MAGGLLDWASDLFATQDERIYGVMVGTVQDNLDLTGLGRVQVSLPALPDMQPWARVAAPFAGSSNGQFTIPQEGDEVLVAFERGDPRQPYVIGSLWSMSSRPPSELPSDAKNKWILKTPKGQTLEFDDIKQTVTITTSTKQEVTISPDEIVVNAGKGTAKAKLGTSGSVEIQAANEISLKAPRITISATGQLDLSGATSKVSASGVCTIQGTSVAIN